jgi:hypothetical protein
MSRDVKLREMLGEAGPLFFPKSGGLSSDEASRQTGSNLPELESNLILMINQWLKHLSV